MADDKTKVQLFLAYGFDKNEAEIAARQSDDFAKNQEKKAEEITAKQQAKSKRAAKEAEKQALEITRQAEEDKIALRAKAVEESNQIVTDNLSAMKALLEGQAQWEEDLDQRTADKKLEIIEATLDEQTKLWEKENEDLRKLTKAGLALTGVGAAITGGLYASGNKEAERQQAAAEMTAETEKWVVAQLRIEKSTERVGRVAMTAVLPTLEKLAMLAEKASKYVEAHPEVAKSLMSAGIIATSIGTLLTVASRGIKFYADMKYEIALAVHSKAVEAHTAALLGSKLGTIAPSAGAAAGSLSKAVTTVSVIATSLIIGSEVGNLIGNAIAKQIYGKDYKKQSLGDNAQTALRIAKLPALGASAALTAVGLTKAGTALAQLMMITDKWTGSILGVDGATAKAQAELDKLTANEEELAAMTEVLTNLIKEEAKAKREYANSVADIMRDSARATEDASSGMQKNMRSIAKSLSDAVKSIKSNLEKTLADLVANFAEANTQAEKEYQSQRAEIIQAGADRVSEIQEQAAKDLEALEKSHSDKLRSLTFSRDALGISEENKSYNEQKQAIKDNASDAIKQAREDTAKQLAEAQKNYEEQRQQRLAEYEKQKAEAIAQAAEATVAAKAQAAEQRTQAAQDYEEQKKEIAKRQKEALEDLKRDYDEQQRERTEAARTAIDELGGSLDSELELRRSFYAQIEAENLRHLQAMADAQAATTPVDGSRAIGGYVGAGLYKMHAGEFVANADTTRKLENSVGGRLTQASLLGAGNKSAAVVWNDYRHFEADVPLRVRQEIARDTMQIVVTAMEKANR